MGEQILETGDALPSSAGVRVRVYDGNWPSWAHQMYRAELQMLLTSANSGQVRICNWKIVTNRVQYIYIHKQSLKIVQLCRINFLSCTDAPHKSQMLYPQKKMLQHTRVPCQWHIGYIIYLWIYHAAVHAIKICVLYRNTGKLIQCSNWSVPF